MDAKIRKNKDTLVVAGTGVIAFGVWNVLKSVMLFIEYRSVLEQSFEEEIRETGMTGLLILLILILLTVLGLNLYVGLAARVEGMGIKKRRYRVLACLMLTTHLSSALTSLLALFTVSDETLEDLVAIMIDIMGFFVLLDLVIAAFRIKKWMKQNDAETVGLTER